MKNLPRSLVLCLGVLALVGCPADDDEDSSRDGGVIDRGDAAGRGAAGKGTAAGASEGGKGASEGGKGGITADQAAVGVCQMMEDMGAMGEFASPTDCKGLDDYAKCADETCGSGDCNDGDCKDYLDCYKDAADPCKADCKPSSACTACLSDVGRCAAENCIELVMCGETEAGGACDKLADCCESRSGAAKMACEAAADASRSGGGDKLCETVLSSLCQD
jgi:hypothetical protein